MSADCSGMTVSSPGRRHHAAGHDRRRPPSHVQVLTGVRRLISWAAPAGRGRCPLHYLPRLLGSAGLAMIVPMFVPSRWRRPVMAADPELSEASEFVADLMEKKEPEGGPLRFPGLLQGSCLPGRSCHGDTALFLSCSGGLRSSHGGSPAGLPGSPV